jgi:hypothetical protein
MIRAGYLPKKLRSLRDRRDKCHRTRNASETSEEIFALTAERNVILFNSSRPVLSPYENCL